jgi:hypothetical protein
MSELHHPVFLSNEGLLSAITSIKAEQKTLKGELAILFVELNRRLAAGRIDPGGFSYNGWSFVHSEGKRTWNHPANVTALAEQLKNAQAEAIANNTATATIGDPFWTIKVLNT